jgi:hypothetical protein
MLGELTHATCVGHLARRASLSLPSVPSYLRRRMHAKGSNEWRNRNLNDKNHYKAYVIYLYVII